MEPKYRTLIQAVVIVMAIALFTLNDERPASAEVDRVAVTE